MTLLISAVNNVDAAAADGNVQAVHFSIAVCEEGAGKGGFDVVGSSCGPSFPSIGSVPIGIAAFVVLSFDASLATTSSTGDRLLLVITADAAIDYIGSSFLVPTPGIVAGPFAFYGMGGGCSASTSSTLSLTVEGEASGSPKTRLRSLQSSSSSSSAVAAQQQAGCNFPSALLAQKGVTLPMDVAGGSSFFFPGFSLSGVAASSSAACPLPRDASNAAACLSNAKPPSSSSHFCPDLPSPPAVIRAACEVGPAMDSALVDTTLNELVVDPYFGMDIGGGVAERTFLLAYSPPCPCAVHLESLTLHLRVLSKTPASAKSAKSATVRISAAGSDWTFSGLFDVPLRGAHAVTANLSSVGALEDVGGGPLTMSISIQTVDGAASSVQWASALPLWSAPPHSGEGIQILPSLSVVDDSASDSRRSSGGTQIAFIPGVRLLGWATAPCSSSLTAAASPPSAQRRRRAQAMPPTLRACVDAYASTPSAPSLSTIAVPGNVSIGFLLPAPCPNASCSSAASELTRFTLALSVAAACSTSTAFRVQVGTLLGGQDGGAALFTPLSAAASVVVAALPQASVLTFVLPAALRVSIASALAPGSRYSSIALQLTASDCFALHRASDAEQGAMATAPMYYLTPISWMPTLEHPAITFGCDERGTNNATVFLAGEGASSAAAAASSLAPGAIAGIAIGSLVAVAAAVAAAVFVRRRRSTLARQAAPSARERTVPNAS